MEDVVKVQAGFQCFMPTWLAVPSHVAFRLDVEAETKEGYDAGQHDARKQLARCVLLSLQA